jgi:integrase
MRPTTSSSQVQMIVQKARGLRIELYICVVVQAYMGCRISEIANRRVGDIRMEEGIWVLDITEGKTTSSRRLVPLHGGRGPWRSSD